MNSEMGLLIESSTLAEDTAKDMQPENAWQVSFDEKGKVRWQSGDEVRDQQPARHFRQRVEDVVMMLLPRDFN